MHKDVRMVDPGAKREIDYGKACGDCWQEAYLGGGDRWNRSWGFAPGSGLASPIFVSGFWYWPASHTAFSPCGVSLSC
jgi:hypothetical protein